MLADLERDVVRITNGIRADWGIYVKFTGSGDELTLNADASLDTMSVIKIPVLVALFRAAEAGRVDLGQRLRLETAHQRFGTGVLRTLEAGATFTLRDAAMLMIIQSDNTATDLCFDAVGGPAAVNAVMAELGLSDIRATGTCFDWFRAMAAVMDPAAAGYSPEELFRRGYPKLPAAELAAARERFQFEQRTPFGLSTARAMGRLLELIWRGECAGRAACDEMMAMLRLQQFRSRLPKYLFGVMVAHKTGDFDPFIANDVGVIEPANRPPIVICCFATGHRGIWTNLEEAIARLTEKVYDYDRFGQGAPA